MDNDGSRRQFQVIGPATEKAWRPYVDLLSGLELVLVLVCAYCSAYADLCDSGPESNNYVFEIPAWPPSHHIPTTQFRYMHRSTLMVNYAPMTASLN